MFSSGDLLLIIISKNEIINSNQNKILELQKIIDEKIQNTLLLQSNINNLNKDVEENKLKLIQKNKELKANKEEINTLISASLKLKNKLTQLQALLAAYKAKDKRKS